MRKTLWIGAAVLLIAGGAVAFVHFRSSTTTTTTTTTTMPIPVAPLSGLSDPSGASLHRPALTVKIENTPEARPLWGVNQADVVYEEIVNGGITRLAAIFNTNAPNKVGPVRSVRPTDVGVVSPIGGIFAYSGGAQYAVIAISKAPVKLVDETTGGSSFYRDPNRVAPTNLYLIAPKVFAFGGTPVPPPAMFTYRLPTTKIAGTKIASFTVNLPSIYADSFTWNPTTESWDRSMFGNPDVTGDGARISPKNVIVQWINYAGGVGTMASVGQLVGSGQSEYFVGGRQFKGTWSRSSIGAVTVYRNASGKVVQFTPGQTWIVLPAIGETVSITK